MTDVKHSFDEDDVDLKTIDPDDKIGSSDSDAEDDTPDETMSVPDGKLPDIWLVKLPKSLMERWADVKQEGVTLANMRVYAAKPNEPFHRIVIRLPESPAYDAEGESSTFTLNVPLVGPDNQYVFADKPKPVEDPEAGPSRSRLSRLVGRVAHEGQFQPVLDAAYESKVRTRNRAANRRQRGTIMIDDKLPGGGKLAGGIALADPDSLKQGQANLKMLASGAGRDRSAIALSQKKPGKKETERFARMPRNELVDRLQELFRIKDAWSFKELRESTQQPSEYLREILQMIAVSPRSGPNTNMWLLNATQKANLDMEVAASGGRSTTPVVKAEVKAEAEDKMNVDDEDDEDEDEDDEEDFEEV